MPKRRKFYHVKLVKEGRPIYAKAISTPSDMAAFFKKKIGNQIQEHFVGVYLNARNVPIGWRCLSIGSVTAAFLHPREVLLPAIKLAAVSIILGHNHPSGDSSPSKDDIELTSRIVEAGKIMGIEILDHLIITDGQYLSFKEEGILRGKDR